MNSLDDVLRGEQTNEATANAAADTVEANHTGETQQTDAAAGESQTAAPEAGNDAPPASEHDKLVPLKALEEERKGRQDWKEKAIRFEEELKHLRAQKEQPPAQETSQQQHQPVEMDYQTALINERLNTSEMLLRSKHDDVDEKLAVFQAEAAKNPALGAELLKQRHPYEWMYQQATRMQALASIGDDPVAYREKMRAELLAELQGQQQTQTAETVQQPTQAAAPVLPKSLATSRSAGPRSAATWTGPTALNDILKR
jgi:hypothetical protein